MFRGMGMRGVDGGHGGLGDLCLCGGDGSDTFCCCGRPVLTKLLRVLAPGRTSTGLCQGLVLKVARIKHMWLRADTGDSQSRLLIYKMPRSISVSSYLRADLCARPARQISHSFQYGML
jgi:hypothetical protein